MSERKRPRQWFGPVALQDVKVGAANATRPDLDQGGPVGDLRSGHLLDLRLGAWTIERCDLHIRHVKLHF